MRGIILAGGSGTRLYPITMGVSKAAATRVRQTDDLRSASTLMMAGIRDIQVITTAHDAPAFSECSATARSSASTSAMRRKTVLRVWLRPSSSAPTISAAIRWLWHWATTSFMDRVWVPISSASN